MVVNINNNDCFFLMDVPDIVITGLTQEVTVSITQTSEFFRETYTPVDGKVVMKDMGGLLKPYAMTQSMMDVQDVAYKAPVFFTINVISDTSQLISISVVHATAQMGCRPENYHSFLSYYSDIDTSLARREYLSFLAQDDTVGCEIGVACRNGENDVYTKIPIPLTQHSMNIVTLNCALSKIAQKAGVNVDDVIYYDVYLKEGTVEKDKVRFHVPQYRMRNEVNFVYLNYFGVPENFTATGIAENSPELTGEKVVLMNASRRISPRLDDHVKVNTGVMTPAKFNALKCLAVSEEVILYDEESHEAVIIEDISLNRQYPSNKIQSAEISYMPAEHRSAYFYRAPSIKPGIFDKTFDHTFD